MSPVEPAYFWPALAGLPLAAALLSRIRNPWRLAESLLSLGFALSLLVWVQSLIWPAQANELFHLTPLTSTLALLISFIALVVLRYAKSNLAQDPDNRRFLTWLLATVAAVLTTVISNHLLTFWVAWVAISLSLHQLLMFYPDRPRAALAAHKKFLLARLAEALLAVAFVLLYQHHQTAQIDEILARYPAESVSWPEQLAAVLLGLVALIKCAQLPVHGWLIQVVEAPTPVSALLHAGVINLGGFLLLLFAPLFAQVSAAQWLVLVVAGLSTMLAALIMTTRISVKVRLAWSTVAQMGLMLVECALGLYELALLHLLAHSCYKAHAFLSAGNAVNLYLAEQLTVRAKPSLGLWATASASSALLVAAAMLLGDSAAPVSPWLLVGTAATFATAFRYQYTRSWLQAELSGAFLVVVYLWLKTATAQLLPELRLEYSAWADAWVSLLWAGFCGAYFALRSPRSQRFFIALNAGFYLDEGLTRLTLWLWPVRLPRTCPKYLAQTQEVAL